MKYLFVFLFIIGGLFINVSHIFAWWLDGKKPTHNHWKLYGFIGFGIWLLIVILANTIL